MFNLVTGYLRADAGSVVFDGWTRRAPPGRPAAGGSPERSSSRALRRLTLVENLTLGGPAAAWPSFFRRDVTAANQARAEEVLDEFGLADLAENLAGALSYGQQKLPEFATDADERPQARAVGRAVGRVNPVMVEQHGAPHPRPARARITFLVVEHDMNLVMRLCDPVIVMDHGAKLAEGRPRDVQRNPAVLDAYLGG